MVRVASAPDVSRETALDDERVARRRYEGSRVKTATKGSRTGPDNCSAAMLAIGQRSAAVAGGSDTMIVPPGRTNRRAHSRVHIGSPKARAVTTSNRSANRGSRPSRVTSAVSTDTRSLTPSCAHANRSRSIRRSRRSVNTIVTSGRRTAITSPGNPPPEPRSTIVRQDGGRAATNAVACSIAPSSETSPIAPR